MRVWTRGAEHVALTGKGTFIFRSGAARRRYAMPRAARDRGNTDVFAVTPMGSVAWLDRLTQVSLVTGEMKRLARPTRVEDLAALDEMRVAAIMNGMTKKGGPLLVVGDPRASTWQWRLELKAEGAPRAEVFSHMAWAKPADLSWCRSIAFGPNNVEGRRRMLVSANQHGVAVAGSRSGLVGVLRPGAIQLSCLVRVPSRERSILYAVATATGVLVTLGLDGRNAAVAHFDHTGRCLGATELLVTRIGAVIAGDRVLVFDNRTSDQLVRAFLLPDLTELKGGQPCSIGMTPIDAHASRDGGTAVFGGGNEVVVVGISVRGLRVVERFTCASTPQEALAPEPERAEVEPPRVKRRYRPCEGPPALGFAVTKGVPVPWSGQTGSPLEIVMSVRSTGGAGVGVRVELSGPAITEGLVVPERVKFGAQGAAFAPDEEGGAAAALLPDAAIPCGIAYPFDPKPTNSEALAEATSLLAATNIEVYLVLRAARAGSALLSVSMRPSAGASAPMKWTRPVIVEG